MIRKANKFDINDVLKLLINFRNNAPHDFLHVNVDELYFNKLFHQIVVGNGICLVAERDNKLIGTIIGIITPNIWDPTTLVLNELAYWVEPEYRNTMTGYKLLKKYVDEAKSLHDNKIIKLHTMSKMINSPDLDYSRFGYKKTEETWVAGAI